MTQSVSAQECIDAAVAATGLDDFGGDSFREGLDAYAASLTEEAGLNDLGAAAVGATVTASLANRLRVVDWARSHPEVAGEAIASPIMVIGMFRAGTTLLSNLLDQDPANRSLLRWESADSVPPPSPDDWRSGPRVDAARQQVAMLDMINPAARVTHHEEADGPTECVTLLAQDFRSLQWEAIANVPSYSEWLLAADQHPAYAYHRRALQVLQSGGVRGRWALKSPHHAIALEALTATYPDARVVLLHRDPVVLCASVCSLIRTMSGPFSDADHSAYIADHWTAMLEESVSRIESFRRAHPEVGIHDVQYSDLVQRPLEAVENLYRFFGLELDGDAARAIQDYVTAHPKGEFGAHRYDLADLGLDGPALSERFAGYRETYDIPEERAARP